MAVVVVAGKRRPDQLAVAEAFLFSGTLGGNGIKGCVFHGATCWSAATFTGTAVIVGCWNRRELSLP